jgi:tRNA isopentenyl-2-thiomethyl-A-37 hydroxylase MiaE
VVWIVGVGRGGVFNAEARRFGEYAELHKNFSTRMALNAKVEFAEEAEASP